MSINNIVNDLLENVDLNYKAFSQKLIPDCKYEFLGIRVPVLKSMAKKYVKLDNVQEFLRSQHVYYEEYLLHGLILAYLKQDFNDKLLLLKAFLPYVDNWAICDMTVQAFKDFGKNPKTSLQFAYECIKCSEPYIKRFGIVVLLTYFLDENFDNSILEKVAKISSTNYYVNMAVAWFMSVALVKQYDYALPYITSKTLTKFVQNKSIQKAIESFRIPLNKKELLKRYKIK